MARTVAFNEHRGFPLINRLYQQAKLLSRVFERRMTMKRIANTLDSREVAKMLQKEHKELLRDIRRYGKQLGESKIALSDFFYGIHLYI